jgi:hypothetical protein
VRSSRVVLVAAFAAFMLSGFAPSAGAATSVAQPPQHSVGAKSAGRTETALPFAPFPAFLTAASASSISCETAPHHPHNSSHEPGYVNVVGTTNCTAPVAEISLQIALYYNGALVAESPVVTVHGTNTHQVNVAVPCSPGTYQGWLWRYWSAGPGYSPPFFTGEQWSTAVDLTC